MSSTVETPALVRWTTWIEDATVLDVPVRIIEPKIARTFGSGARGALLRGEWLGHALHPSLTDVVIGAWTSATVLDLVGGAGAAPAARRLVGVGLLAAGPTAWSGWAEWSGSGPREKRVGLVHAATVGTAAATYASSWLARRRGDRRSGVVRGLMGAAALTAGGYLGGHLAIARKVGTHHPAHSG